MPLKLSASSGGSVTLEPTNTASNYTLTVPAVSGQVQVQNNMPAFSAYSSSNQSISSLANTKVTLDVEVFDTNSNFSSSRFTPTIAGYYQISYSIYYSSAFTYGIAKLYKNGGSITWSEVYGGAAATPNPVGSCLIYLNGSTDYVELYAQTNNNNTVSARVDLTWLSGVLVRAA